MTPLLPGATICILGGGQLGRMSAIAARSMGYKVIILDPTANCPAGQVADRQIVAPYDDARAATEIAATADVVTLEFENLPVAVVERIEATLPVRPSARVLGIAQDRLREKSFLAEHGIAVAPFAPVYDEETASTACAIVGLPAVLKTATLGYDGKGQRIIRTPDEARAAHAALGGACILEQLIPFERELSVVVARDLDGNTVTYEPAENVHLHGILDTSITPAPVPERIRSAAREIALRIAQALDLLGVLAVEFFLTPSGALLVNELAPRPHNSGHWSIEACVTSQFEQQVRTVVGGQAGAADLLRPAATANLMGDLWAAGEPHWERLLAMPDIKLHLYGKAEARPGRKMGHLTALAGDGESARARVLAARAALTANDISS